MPPGRFHGIIVVDKPGGWTSHDVVARVRRLLGERRVGHAGTLDPAATGVLPVAVGAATRVLEFLSGATKTYVAEVRFGVSTDSYDADGVVTMVADASDLSEAAVRTVLAEFRGAIEQLPPMHSAVKVGGQRLYDLARRGEAIDRAPRPVVISALELLKWEPPTATLLVDCSKGTYVRSLAHDLGERLGVGAHLANLVRIRSGPFTLCHAVTVEEMGEVEPELVWPSLAFHPDRVVEAWPALLLDAAGRDAWLNGTPLPGEIGAGEEWCRAYDTTGTWLGVGRAAGTAWHPTKVVRPA